MAKKNKKNKGLKKNQTITIVSSSGPPPVNPPPPPPPTYSPPTENWISRLTAVGGSSSTAKRVAVDTALQALQAANLLVHFKYLLVYTASDGFTGCNVPIISSGLAPANMVNFNEAQWSPKGLRAFRGNM